MAGTSNQNPCTYFKVLPEEQLFPKRFKQVLLRENILQKFQFRENI